jgi:hypothetical protein
MLALLDDKSTLYYTDGQSLHTHNGHTFSTWLLCVYALAYVPADCTVNVFESVQWPQVLGDFITEYFEGEIVCPLTNNIYSVNYIGRKFGGVRRRPRFAIADWSLYDRCLMEDMRSNQVCEGFNNGFKHTVGEAHPPLYKLLEKITSFLRNSDIEQVCYPRLASLHTAIRLH